VSIGLNNLGASLRGEAAKLTTLGIPQEVWQPSIETGTIQTASCTAKIHRTQAAVFVLFVILVKGKGKGDLSLIWLRQTT
jgi:hypothetical protein